MPPNQQQMPNMGFENTLSSQDFVINQGQSTPVSSQHTPENSQIFTNIPQSSQFIPAPGQQSHHISPEVQQQIDSQGMDENLDRPLQDEITIRDLRADPGQQDLVNEQMEGFQEQFPSLFPAPTASIPNVSITPAGFQQTPAVLGTTQPPISTPPCYKFKWQCISVWAYFSNTTEQCC